jgi:hypothetical protein
MDLETAPEARLSLASHRLVYTLAFLPRLTFWDLAATGFHPVLLAAGSARVEWRGRRTRTWLEETASYGGMSFASFAATPGPDGVPPRVDAIPSARIIAFESTRTTLGARSELGRYVVSTAVGYQRSGGADADARTVLPSQQGPFGEARLDVPLSRQDHAETSVVGSEAAFSSGPEDLIVEVAETHRRLWRRTTETRFTLGVSEARVRTSALSPHTTETHPVAEAVLEEHDRLAGGRFDVRASVRLGPMVNQVVGLVDQRIQATLAATHGTARLTTHAYAGAGQSVTIDGPYALRIVSGEVGASYAFTPVFALDGGIRGLAQSQPNAGVTFLQATVFAGVTLRAPVERF